MATGRRQQGVAGMTGACPALQLYCKLESHEGEWLARCRVEGHMPSWNDQGNEHSEFLSCL